MSDEKEIKKDISRVTPGKVAIFVLSFALFVLGFYLMDLSFQVDNNQGLVFTGAIASATVALGVALIGNRK